MIKPKKNTISIPHSPKQCASSPQSDPSPGLTFSNPGIQKMRFQPARNSTFCMTPPSPTHQQFNHAKLQNKKIRLSTSAPHWFSTEGSQYQN